MADTPHQEDVSLSTPQAPASTPSENVVKKKRKRRERLETPRHWHIVSKAEVKLFSPHRSRVQIRQRRQPSLYEGEGVMLEDIKPIANNVDAYSRNDSFLRELHIVLFSFHAKATSVKDNILSFSGFNPEKMSERLMTKKLEGKSLSFLKQLNELLCLSTSGSKDTLIRRAIAFLQEPSEEGIEKVKAIVPASPKGGKPKEPKKTKEANPDDFYTDTDSSSDDLNEDVVLRRPVFKNIEIEQIQEQDDPVLKGLSSEADDDNDDEDDDDIPVAKKKRKKNNDKKKKESDESSNSKSPKQSGKKKKAIVDEEDDGDDDYEEQASSDSPKQRSRKEKKKEEKKKVIVDDEDEDYEEQSSSDSPKRRNKRKEKKKKVIVEDEDGEEDDDYEEQVGSNITCPKERSEKDKKKKEKVIAEDDEENDDNEEDVVPNQVPEAGPDSDISLKCGISSTCSTPQSSTEAAEQQQPAESAKEVATTEEELKEAIVAKLKLFLGTLTEEDKLTLTPKKIRAHLETQLDKKLDQYSKFITAQLKILL